MADDELCPEFQRHPVIRATSRWHNFSIYSSIYSSGVLVVARATARPGRDMARLQKGVAALLLRVGVSRARRGLCLACG